MQARPMDKSIIIAKLREHEPELKAAGIVRLSLFGSVARGDQTPLPGFEQNDYVKNGNFAEQSLADLVAEFGLVRASTLALFRSFNAEAWTRRGTASNNPITVRALAFIIAGHELHHRDILKERYFPAIPRA